MIRDDVIGFDAAQADLGNGLGILGMRERVALAGGRLEITSGPGRGTTVIVSIPLFPSGRDGNKSQG
jgi:signal transduction histidine kinase